MSYAERTLDFLWVIAPDGLTNADIARRLGTTSQTVYMLMQDLMRRGLVRGEQQGRTWVFYALDEPEVPAGGALARAAFEALARRILSERYAVELVPGSVRSVHKQFDFVSSDGQIVGDAKYYTRVRGTALQPTKFATIAEHVWLLEKTGASTAFLVFGNDREIPVLWLERHGNLATSVVFYFLADDGQLEVLMPADTATAQTSGRRRA